MYIAGNKGVIAPSDSRDLFAGYTSLKKLDFQDAFNTGNVTDMRYMFNGCGSLGSLDVSGFNTGKVTDMRSMFYGCGSLGSLDVSGFDIDRLMDMEDMFLDCNAEIVGKEKLPYA